MTTTKTTTKKADGIQNQILIYSKNWYGQTDNAIRDIRAIMANCLKCHSSYISDKDAKANIIGAFETYCPTYDRIEALMMGLGVKKPFPNQEPNIYDLMLAKLSCTLGDCVDMEEKLDISFGTLQQTMKNDEEIEECIKARRVSLKKREEA